MNKEKLVIIIETIMIIILVIIIIFLINVGYSSNKETYCSKNYYNSKACLLSSRVYTKIIPANSFLILNFKQLETDIQDYITENNLNVSVYVLNLRDGASFGINEDIPYEPASLNKLPIAMIILKKIEGGKLTFDTMLPITNDERDISSGTLYNSKLIEISVRDLLYYMLSESDNTALWTLGKQVTLRDIQRLSDYLNYYQDNIDYISKTNNNTYEITAKSIGNLFSSLYLSTALKPENSELILSHLTNTNFNIKKYANIPDDIVIAQKYGSYYAKNKKLFYDCGIIYVETSRIFYCIMTQNLDREEASQVIGTNVNKIYNFIIEKRKIKNIEI